MLVLIVDDSEGVRDAIATALRGSGYSVEWAANTSEATERIATTPYDAIILDVHLPDGSGVQIMDTIAKLAPSTVVLLTSGSSADSLVDAAIRAYPGYSSFEPKPFSVSRLLYVLKAMLTSREEESAKQGGVPKTA